MESRELESQSLKNVEQIFRPEKASSGRVAGPRSRATPPQCDFTKGHYWSRFPSTCVRGRVQVAHAARTAASPLELWADGSNVVGGEGCHKMWHGLAQWGLAIQEGEFFRHGRFLLLFSFSSQQTQDHNSNPRQPATNPRCWRFRMCVEINYKPLFKTIITSAPFAWLP